MKTLKTHGLLRKKVVKTDGFLLRCSPFPPIQAQADGALQSNAVDGSDVRSLLFWSKNGGYLLGKSEK